MARSKHFTRNPYAKILYFGIRQLVEGGNTLTDVLDIFALDDDDLDDLIEEHSEDYEEEFGKVEGEK